MYKDKLVKEQIGSTEKFVAMTRPLLTVSSSELMEHLLLLEIKHPEVMGCASEIIKLQTKELVNEIALRN